MQETETRNLVFLLNNTSKKDLYNIISKLELQQPIEDLYIKLCHCYVTNSTGLYTSTISDIVHLYNINKIGEWNISSDGYYPYCSLCGKEPEDGALHEHCPHCGANMIESVKYYKEIIDRLFDKSQD